MWFELDQKAIAATARRESVLFHVVVAVLVAAAACSPWGRAALAVHPLFIVLGTLVFIGNYVTTVSLASSGQLFQPERWGRRLINHWQALFYTACFAAPSEFDAPATWAFVPMAGAVVGVNSVRLSVSHFGIAAASTVGFHLVSAPELSTLSVVAAVWAGALTSLATVVGFRFARTAQSFEARSNAAREIAEDARAHAARLATAMSVHDGLSATVFAARTQLETPGHDSPRVINAVLERARALVGAQSNSQQPLSAELERLAPGIACTVDPSFELLPARERDDLRFIALELTGNALRHREFTRISVRLTGGKVRSVEVIAEGTRRAGQGQGRGSRHLALRAACWGGATSLENLDHRSVARAEWAAPASAKDARWVAMALPLAALGFVPMSWLGEGSVWMTGFTVAGVALAFVGSLVGMRRLAIIGGEYRAFDDERARTERESEVELQVLREAMARLEKAKPAELKAELNAFSQSLTQVMRTLENRAA